MPPEGPEAYRLQNTYCYSAGPRGAVHPLRRDREIDRQYHNPRIVPIGPVRSVGGVNTDGTPSARSSFLFVRRGEQPGRFTSMVMIGGHATSNDSCKGMSARGASPSIDSTPTRNGAVLLFGHSSTNTTRN